MVASGASRRAIHRVRAAEITPCSLGGRANKPIDPPDSAANCNRRLPAMLSRLPSAMIIMFGVRNAVSIAHKRTASFGGSTKKELEAIDRATSVCTALDWDESCDCADECEYAMMMEEDSWRMNAGK